MDEQQLFMRTTIQCILSYMNYRKPNRAERRLLKKQGIDYTEPTLDIDETWTLQDQRDIEDDMIEILDELEGEEYKFAKTIQQYRSQGFDTPPEEWAYSISAEEIAAVRSDSSLKFFPVGANPYANKAGKSE